MSRVSLFIDDTPAITVSTMRTRARRLKRQKALDMIDQNRVLATIRMADDAMRRLDIENPKIAVAGVNPHAGEGGLFGRDEIDVLEPAIAIAKQRSRRPGEM